MIKKFNVDKTKKLDVLNKVLSKIYKKPLCKNIVPISDVKNILIIDFALMGDMIMDIPFLKTIKHNCPKSSITMVAMPWAKVILEDQNLVDEFIIFDGKNKLSSPKRILNHFFEIVGVIKKINNKKYEIGIEPKGDIRHTLLLRYTKCDRTVSYNYTGGEFLITDSFSPKNETTHLVDEKLDLLEMLGMKIREGERIPELKLNANDLDYINHFRKTNSLDDKYIIGLHPGASNANKQYGYYPDLIELIKTHLRDNVVVMVFEGPGEANIVDLVCNKLEILHVNYLRIKKSINEYVKLVSLCDVMICNDSAAGHIAAAYDINTVVIFGPIDPKTAIPRGRCRILPISHPLDCKPCTMPVCPFNTDECIKKIEPVEISKAVISLLKIPSKEQVGGKI